MKMSELSRASGVPIATIKFYLREKLLPAGRATAATQAQYDEKHLARLRLIRALVDVGGLPLAAVGLGPTDERMQAYARAALEVAQVDVAGIPRGTSGDAVQYVVVGTVLYEPVLLALRRLAQQHVFSTTADQARSPR